MSPPPENGLCDRLGFCWNAISLSDVFITLINSDICARRALRAESSAFTTGLTALQYRQQDN